MAAEELRPTGWKENRLFIAKCNIQLGNFSVASTWLKQAADSPFITPEVSSFIGIMGCMVLIFLNRLPILKKNFCDAQMIIKYLNDLYDYSVSLPIFFYQPFHVVVLPPKT